MNIPETRRKKTKEIRTSDEGLKAKEKSEFSLKTVSAVKDMNQK